MKIFFLFIITFPLATTAQSIRKNYIEMDVRERTEYVRVMNDLYSEAVISNFVASHRMPNAGGFAQHNNDDFLPWHRIFLYYMDNEIKSKNRYLNLSYVDWYSTVSRDDVLFSNGTFQNRQGLLGLPLRTDWEQVINDRRFETVLSSWTPSVTFLGTNTISRIPTYNIFRERLEYGVHGGFHVWVGGNGGEMGRIASSPLDPVFYFHHTMVDKVWEQWNIATWNKTDFGGIRPNLGSVVNKPTYNGRDIFDSRAVKVWYAENNNLVLDKYTVSNQTLGVYTGKEFYFYPKNIEVAGSAANYFTVPAGTEAKIESMQEIALLPGFSVEPGATFGAEIIPAFPIGTGFGGMRIENKEVPLFDIQANKLKGNFSIYPNPNNGKFTIVPNDIEVYKVEIFNLSGNKIATIDNSLEINLDLSNGVYLAVVTDIEGTMHSRKFVIN